MLAITVNHRVLDDVVAHARERQPAECCGLLIGRDARIVRAVRARNLADHPDRFLIDPRDHIDARRDARGQDLDVIGFYHSHPHSNAYPSRTDQAEAGYADAVYLIVGLATDPPEVRFFKLSTGSVEEAAATIEP